MTTNRKPAANATGPQEDAARLFEIEPTRPRPQISVEWDRRRAAERRLLPLADGRRDPLRRGAPNGTPADRTVWIEVGPRNTAAVTGSRIMLAIKKLDLPYQWHPHRRDVLCIPANQVDDLVAYLEHRGRRRVEVVAVERV